MCVLLLLYSLHTLIHSSSCLESHSAMDPQEVEVHFGIWQMVERYEVVSMTAVCKHFSDIESTFLPHSQEFGHQ